MSNWQLVAVEGEVITNIYHTNIYKVLAIDYIYLSIVQNI